MTVASWQKLCSTHHDFHCVFSLIFWRGMHAVYIYTMWFFRFNFPSQYSIKVAVFKLFASTFCKKKNLDWDMWGITLLQTSNTVVHAPSCMRSIAWWSSAWEHCDVICEGGHSPLTFVGASVIFMSLVSRIWSPAGPTSSKSGEKSQQQLLQNLCSNFSRVITAKRTWLFRWNIFGGGEAR